MGKNNNYLVTVIEMPTNCSESDGAGDLKQESEHRKTTDTNTFSDCTNFFRVWIDIGYFFLIVPFRIKDNSTIHVNKIQKVICGIGYFCTIYRYVTEVRRFPFNSLKRDPVTYFLFFQTVASVIFHSAVYKILWFDAAKFVKIDEFIKKSENLPKAPTKLTSRIFIATICLIQILFGIVGYILGFPILDTLSYEDPSWAYRRFVAEARFEFFMSSSVNFSTAPDMENISTMDHILGGTFIATNFFRCLTGYYTDSITLMACITLWIPSIAFAAEIKSQIQRIESKEGNENVSKIKDILRKYNELKELSELINAALQWAVCAHMLDVVTYFSIYINLIFVATNWLVQVSEVIAILVMAFIFATAPDICRRIGTMRAWVCHERISREMSQKNIVCLLNELSTNPVSISGGIFTMDYRFVGKIATTIVTYFIVCSSIGPYDFRQHAERF